MPAFQGKVAIVTGASEGIGRAFCLALAPQRPLLAVAARNEDRLNSLKAEAEALGAQVLAIPADVTRLEDCRAIIDKTVEAYGRIDVLVNNAGGTMWTFFEEIEDLTLFDRLMHLNYLSAVYCTHFALPHLKASRGRIAAVSSVAGLMGVPTRSAYCATKHAMFGFFEALRVELRGSGVSVTMIAPDFVLSEVHRRALGADGQPIGVSPMQEGKIMTAETCAAMMVRALEGRKRLLITSLRGRVGRWIKLIAPGLAENIAVRAIHNRK